MPKTYASSAAPTSGGSTVLKSSPASDHTVSGITTTFTAQVNMAIGDLVYFKTTTVDLIDADVIGTCRPIAICADATISASASGNFLLQGFIRDDSWNWTVGAPIYASVTGTTGNTLTQTAPTGTDDCVCIVGIAVSADVLYFAPNLNVIERT